MQNWVESDPEAKAEKATDTVWGQRCQAFSLCPSHSSDICMTREKVSISTKVAFTFLKSKCCRHNPHRRSMLHSKDSGGLTMYPSWDIQNEWLLVSYQQVEPESSFRVFSPSVTLGILGVLRLLFVSFPIVPGWCFLDVNDLTVLRGTHPAGIYCWMKSEVHGVPRIPRALRLVAFYFLTLTTSQCPEQRFSQHLGDRNSRPWRTFYPLLSMTSEDAEDKPACSLPLPLSSGISGRVAKALCIGKALWSRWNKVPPQGPRCGTQPT